MDERRKTLAGRRIKAACRVTIREEIMKARVGIIGATGYAGAELVRLLSGHPGVTLSVITSRQYVGKAYGDVYPAMAGVVDLTCEAYDPEKIAEKADLLFIALPHKVPMGIVPDLLCRGKKVVDLSADFRFSDVERYEAHYQPHTAKELLADAVYGLSDVYHEKIALSDLVGNPGCYPTSTLLPLIPLLRENLLAPSTIVVDSKSGVSGAGRGVSLGTHFCEVNEGFKAYKAADHRHSPEMEEVLSREAGEEVAITFVPHLLPATRGMLSTIYASLKRPVEEKEIRGVLEDFYASRQFVRIAKEGAMPDISHVRGTNYCNIGVKLDARNGRLVIVSVIDNLVKGAAGQAVQNMNIMLGLDDGMGLSAVPFAV